MTSIPAEAEPQGSSPPTSGVATDQATGVLVLALQVLPDKAFQLLGEAAHRHHVDLAELAEAIVIVASGNLPNSPGHWDVLSEEWGDLLL